MVSRLKSISKSTNNKSLSLNNNDNMTIDAKHSEMINHFKEQSDSLPKMKNELKKIIAEYNHKDPDKKTDLDYIIYKDNLKDKINELKNKINVITNNDDLNKYYLDVGILLHSYYENIENSKNNEHDYEKFERNLLDYEEDEIEENNDLPTLLIDESVDDQEHDAQESQNNYKSVINFFNERDNKTSETPSEENVYTSLKISDFVKEESTFKKKNILEEYLQKIDNSYVSKIKVDINIFKCPNCSTEMTVFPSDGIQICEKCGLQQNVLIESDKPSFKDPPMEVCYFSYKRINHYNELAIYDKKLLTNIIKNSFLYKFIKKIKKMIFNFTFNIFTYF
jgi:hypothetical protein